MSFTVNRPTSLGLSVLLHVLFLSAGLVAALLAGPPREIVVTPVTLIGPDTPGQPAFAEQAEVETPAQTEAPEDILPPTPVADIPAPTPAPKSPPAPKQAPTPRSPPPKTPAPSPRPAPQRPAQPTFDMNKLDQQLAEASRNTGVQRSGGQRGPTQAQRDLEARLGDGSAQAATADAIAAIVAKIGSRWNISCASAEDRAVTVRLRLELTREGGLARATLEDYPNVDAIPDARVRAAAIGALSAARAAAPFSGLPEQTYSQWRSNIYRFPASDICAQRMGR